MNCTSGRAALRLALLSFGLSVWAAQSDDAAAQAQRAKDLMAAGRYEQAIPIYKQLVQAMPGNAGLTFNLALAEHMAGHEREAIPNFEAVLKQQPNHLPALVSLGAARLAVGEPAAAVAPLEKAVAADPKNQDARGMLAGALLESGHPDRAAAEYRKLTSASPDDPRAWSGLGNAYQAMAIEAFDQLQKLDAKSPYVAALVADTRVQRRQYRSAFFFYSEALKQLPKLHGVHAALAEVYRKTGHNEWAVDEDAKEQALPAADCAAHAAECEFLAGHDLQLITAKRAAAPSAESLFWQSKAANELALQAFFRLGQLPPSIEMHQLKAQIARDQNQPLESVKEWRAALAMAPGDPRLRHELTVSLFLAGDYSTALSEAEGLLKLDPRSPEINFLAGDSLLRQQEPEKAIPYLRAALSADPKLLAAEASLGLALARTGKNAEAIPHLEKAQELDDDGSLHYQLARAYQAAGQAEKAQAAMSKYQEIQKRNQEQKEEVAREAQIGPPR
ncbi:MAG TPA: tetratricopeptide repeat protein [Bryobacteraceae bacterium]